MRSIGFPELLVILIVGGLGIVPAWKIFSKAGYPGILSLANASTDFQPCDVLFPGV